MFFFFLHLYPLSGSLYEILIHPQRVVYVINLKKNCLLVVEGIQNFVMDGALSHLYRPLQFFEVEDQCNSSFRACNSFSFCCA